MTSRSKVAVHGPRQHREQRVRHPVPRQRLVVNRLMEGFQGALTTSKFARLAKCSTDTALRDIVTLVERGVLVRNPGGGRSTSYRVATFEELEELELRD
mgnify:CR=1 FL=1